MVQYVIWPIFIIKFYLYSDNNAEGYHYWAYTTREFEDVSPTITFGTNIRGVRNPIVTPFSPRWPVSKHFHLYLIPTSAVKFPQVSKVTQKQGPQNPKLRETFCIAHYWAPPLSRLCPSVRPSVVCLLLASL